MLKQRWCAIRHLAVPMRRCPRFCCQRAHPGGHRGRGRGGGDGSPHPRCNDTWPQLPVSHRLAAGPQGCLPGEDPGQRRWAASVHPYMPYQPIEACASMSAMLEESSTTACCLRNAIFHCINSLVLQDDSICMSSDVPDPSAEQLALAG